MRIGFIGAGNMGSALATAAAKGENEVFLYDKDTDKAARTAKRLGAFPGSLDELCKSCEVIFLGVKPNILPNVSAELSGKLNTAAVLVSMAAGVSLTKLNEMFPNMPIIRIMPNTPCEVGEGMIVWCKNELVTDGMADEIIDAMSGAGAFLKIDEKNIDAATAVSGCGPAFVYMFIDALMEGGIDAGLSYEASRTLAAHTLIGAAEMILQKSEDPETLRIAVCSPGGSTIEGVKSLLNDNFKQTVTKAVGASYRRTQELGK